VSPESSAIVLFATGVAAGAGAAAGCDAGSVVVGGDAADFGSLGSQASSSNPSPSFFSFWRLAVAATAVEAASDFVSKAFSSTTSFAGLAGVGLVFFVLSRRAPPGPLNNPPAAEES
jgi:hypothetical protein